MDRLSCIACRGYLLSEPWQVNCGHHLCGGCYKRHQSSSDNTAIHCYKCELEMEFVQCFRDKAIEREVNSTHLTCTNAGCSWSGEAKHIVEHVRSCVFSRPETTGSLNRQKDNVIELPAIVQPHLPTSFAASSADVKSLESRQNLSQPPELGLPSKDAFKVMKAQLDSACQELTSLSVQIAGITSGTTERVQPLAEAVTKLDAIVQTLRSEMDEINLLFQTVQAASYNGVYVWKIPEVRRRRQDAVTGRVVSLYSVPFYTSKHGYKICLRLYLNGDGQGKGTHLSFFLSLMKGEYDSLLQWPFVQAVTLMLLDQDKRKNVTQSFRPEKSSSSFQRPKGDINVASGCPMFAPLSLLDNPSYVRDDVMFLKCIVDLAGLSPDDR